MSTPLGRSPARLAAEPVEKKAVVLTAPLTAEPVPAGPPPGAPWHVSMGLGLWRLRNLLSSGIVSAALHTLLMIVLTFIIVTPWEVVTVPPLTHLEAVIVPPKVERREIPQTIEAVKLDVKQSVKSMSPQNLAARGLGSSGEGGGHGGGVLGGVKPIGIQRSSEKLQSGGTGSGIDKAFGTDMLGEVGELGEAKATFFGVEAQGRKFVFVVDTSGSMRHNSRYLRCRDELLRSVTSMQYGQQYFIIFFSDKLYPMPENKLVYAKPDQLQKTSQWLVGATPDGGTEPWPGLQRALRMEPDAIFLLTDGQFDPEVVRKVDRIQPETKKKIPIHTIAFESQQGAVLLEAIAKQSGGTFRFVP